MKPVFRILCLTLVLLLTGACAPTPSGNASEAQSSGTPSSASSKEDGNVSEIASQAASETFNSDTASGEEEAPFAYAKLSFRRGMNINRMEGEYYSSAFWSGTAYLGKDSTYTDLKAKGFDHVRFPVDLRMYYDAETKTLTDRMKDVDMVIDKAIAAGLYIILDFHGWYDLNTGDTQQVLMFLNIWERVAERYRDKSDLLSFEFLNEPHTTEGGNLTTDAVNYLQETALERVRRTNPTRLVLWAVGDWNSAWQLKKVSLPAGDPNIAVVIHNYTPMAFSHQGMTWANPNYTKQVRLTDEMLAEMQKELDMITAFTESTGISVNLNEFAVGHTVADEGDVVRWLTTIRSYCEAHDIPWTYWQYIGDQMGARQSATGDWYDFVMKGLGLK